MQGDSRGQVTSFQPRRTLRTWRKIKVTDFTTGDTESTEFDCLHPEWRSQQAERERDREIDDFQNAMHRHAYDAEREQEQPHERVGDQCQERERPAEDEQDAPEKQSEHRNLLLTSEE